MAYQPRTYRSYTRSDDLVSFRVVVAETDLFISSEKDLSIEAEGYVRSLRKDIEAYINTNPEFQRTLSPIDIKKDAPFIVKDMAESAKAADVGPMAAVAGAIADQIGRQLLRYSPQVIVENGGDIFISSKRPRRVGIYAGRSKFSEKVAVEVMPEQTPCGICTSSGTIGHSLSFGNADAAIILSPSASLADAFATAVCNRVKTKDDIDKVITYGRAISGVTGIIIIIGDNLGVWGNIKLVDI
jgi:ApbE superfamily uncharacterized protein (UPF0280 family)